jgi:hypothetical protein
LAKYLILIFGFFLLLQSVANQRDSLLYQLSKAKDAKTKQILNLDLGETYMPNEPKKALHYFQNAYSLADSVH